MPELAQRLTLVPATAPHSTILPMEARGLVFEAAGKPLVDGIDLTLEAGLRTLVIGPNGAGKSLLLRLLHGLLPPTAGTVLWRGRTADQAIRLRQAMVFQKPVLLRRSVAANIDYALRVHGLPAAERADRLQQALGLARLDGLAARPARVLSGGEQQRLALARALAVEPEVLFLDEPTASLDPALDAGGRGDDRARPRGGHQDRPGHPRSGSGTSSRRRGGVSASRPGDRADPGGMVLRTAPVGARAGLSRRAHFHLNQTWLLSGFGVVGRGCGEALGG